MEVHHRKELVQNILVLKIKCQKKLFKIKIGIKSRLDYLVENLTLPNILDEMWSKTYLLIELLF